MRNRIGNVHNMYQDFDKFTRILTVCSAGLLRSPTIARVLTRDFDNTNVRSAGISKDFALVVVDEALIEWADIIITAEEEHLNFIEDNFSNVINAHRYRRSTLEKPLISLNIPDKFNFSDAELIKIIREKLTKISSREHAINGEFKLNIEGLVTTDSNQLKSL